MYEVLYTAVRADFFAVAAPAESRDTRHDNILIDSRASPSITLTYGVCSSFSAFATLLLHVADITITSTGRSMIYRTSQAATIAAAVPVSPSRRFAG